MHLTSVGLQLAQVTWMSTRQLPFYVRGLLRAVPAGLLPEVFAIATLTDPDIEVMLDHHLMLWARVKNWADYRPIFDGKFLGISYEEAFQNKLETVVVSQLELAEAFLDQKDEGQPTAPVEDYDDMEDETGAIRASEAPSIKSKDTPKRQREQVEDPEKKRVRKGGPPAIPSTWRSHPSQNLVMSFASPEVPDGRIIVVLQAPSQLPAFGRYSIPVATAVRENRIWDNPIDSEHL